MLRQEMERPYLLDDLLVVFTEPMHSGQYRYDPIPGEPMIFPIRKCPVGFRRCQIYSSWLRRLTCPRMWEWYPFNG